MPALLWGFKAGGIILSHNRLWTHFFGAQCRPMRVAQRDLLRITLTFPAMKLLESSYNGQKGEHNISIVGSN